MKHVFGKTIEQCEPNDPELIAEINTLFRMFDIEANAEYIMHWEEHKDRMVASPFNIKFSSNKVPFILWYATAKKMHQSAKRLIEAQNAGK